MGRLVSHQFIVVVFSFFISGVINVNANMAFVNDAIPLPQQLLNEKLLYAIDRGQVDVAIIEKLINKGANTTNTELLELALKHQHAEILQRLLNVSHPTLKPQLYNTLLAKAISLQDWKSANILLKHSNVAINSSLLLNVAKQGHLATFTLMTKHEIIDEDIEQRCLMESVVNGNNNDIVAWFIANAVHLVDNKRCDGLLAIAVENNNLALVKTLVKAGAALNGNQEKESPVQLAITHGNSDVLKFLLKKGALLRRNQYDTPLLNATVSGRVPILDYLLQQEKKSVKSVYLSQLALFAAEAGQLKTLQFLQQRGADLHYKKVRPALAAKVQQTTDASPLVATTTALHLAAEGGHYDVVRYLLEIIKLDVNAKEITGDATAKTGTLTALHFAAQHDNYALVQLLLQHGAAIDEVDQQQGTPLLAAVQHNQLATVRLLVAKDASYDAAQASFMPQLPLQAAVKKQHLPMVNFLLDYGNLWDSSSIINVKNRAGKTALQLAIDTGSLPLVKTLLDQGARADIPDAKGNTALHYAVSAQNHDVFSLLLRDQHQINALNHQEKTPLALAITLYDGFYAAQLLAHGANINLKDQQQQTLLHQLTDDSEYNVRYEKTVAAISNEQLLLLMSDDDTAARIEWLLRHEIDINAQDNKGNTVLHQLAIRSTHIELFKRLLQQKPILDTVNQQGNTALYLAIQAEEEMALLLLQAGANPNLAGGDDKTPLYLSIERDNQDLVKQLIKHGADVNQLNKQGQNPLFALVDAGTSTSMVEQLIAAGINLKSKDQQGNTIIQALSNSMSKDGALPRLKLMLDEGGDSNVTNANLETPLHQAVLSHAPKTAQLLLAAGANPNAQDKDGATPLHYAIRLRAFSQIEQLIAHKAKLNIYNRFGKTALHIAVEEGDQSLVKKLLQAGANLHSVDKDLRTPLITAVANNDTAMALLLLQHHANPNALSKGGWRPLHFAAKQSNTILLQALLKNGANPQHTLWRGDTVEQLIDKKSIRHHVLLHLLITTKADKEKAAVAFVDAANGHSKTPLKRVNTLHSLQTLLEQGADINSTNRYGQTALHNAIEVANVEAVTWLLAQGANPNQADIYQQTPLEKALLPDGDLAPLSEQMLAALLAKGAAINALNRHQETLLLIAVRNKTSLEKVQGLLAKGTTVNVKDSFDNTPLLEASRQGRLAVVEALVTAKADLNQQNQQGENSLHVALSMPIEQGIRHLLAPEQKLSQLSDEEREALTLQAENNYRKISHYLLEQGIDSNVNNQAGQSPLALAVNIHCLTLVKKLLTQQRDNSEFPSLIERAIQQQQFGIAKVLLLHNPDLVLNNAIGWKLLKAACTQTKKADYAAAPLVTLLLEKDADQQINSEKRQHTLVRLVTENDALNTLNVLQQAGVKRPSWLFRYAAQHNALKIARWLIKKDIAINQQDATGKSALMFAAEAGENEMVGLLLAHKADPNQQDKGKRTALTYAVALKNTVQATDQPTAQQQVLQLTQQLIKHGAKTKRVPEALHLAIKSKNDALIAYLIDSLGYKVNDLVAGKTALSVAFRYFKTIPKDVINNKSELTRLNTLITKGAEINRADGKQTYPIQQALHHPAALALLLQHNVETNHLNGNGDSLLHTLVNKHDNDAFTTSLALLLKANVVANSANKQGDTPLHTLLKRSIYSKQEQANSIAKLRLLLQDKTAIDLSAKNKQQQTPLSVALSTYNADKMQPLILALLEQKPVISEQDVLQSCQKPMVLQALLEQGANANSFDTAGRSCLHHVLERFNADNSVALLTLLLKHGADINQQDKQGHPPLHTLVAFSTYESDKDKQQAKQQAQQQALALFWSHKPNVNLRTKKMQFNALFFAANATLVQTLLAQGFAMNSQDQQGNMLLQTTNDIDIARVLIDKGIALEHKNEQGETALFIAIKNNQSRLIDYLLEQGANPNLIDVNGNSVLHTIRSDALAERLLAKGAKVNHINQQGNTPLHTVHSLDLAKRFVAAGAALNKQNNSGQTPLIRAATRKETSELALFFIEQGADVNLKDQWGETALGKTAYTNEQALAKQLLVKGAQPHSVNTLGDYPVHVALSKNNQQVAEMLINPQTETTLDTKNWEERTPLAVAFSKQRFGMAKLLTSQGASKPKWPAHLMAQEGNPFWLQRALQAGLTRVAAQLLVPNEHVDSAEITRRVTLREYGTNHTNLHRAASLGATELITPLLKYGAIIDTVNSQNETALHSAVSAEQLETVEMLLAHKATITAVDDNDNTVLHRATRKSDVGMLAFLLAQQPQKLDINAQNYEGKTALHLACQQQDSATVKLLLQHKVVVDLLDNEQMTPLLIAAKTANEKIITQLLSHNADVTQRDREGRTPLLLLLHKHIYHNFLPIEQRDHAKIVRLVDLLVAHKADLQAIGNDGRMALHLAMPVRQTANHLLDISQGEDLHHVDGEGDTPLFHAVRATYSKENPAEITARLLKMDNTVVKHKNKWGETALQKAIRADNGAAIRLLIENGIDVNAENEGGYTPLLNIVRNEVTFLKQKPLLDLLVLLLTKGADINKTDSNKNTPLHLALATRQDAIARFLLERKADINLQNNHGNTALHLLSKRNSNNEDKEQQQSTLDLVNLLLAKKALVEQRNANSSTPLHLAIKHGQNAVAQQLLAHGADINAANTRGETLLHLAVKKGNEQRVKQLLEQGATIAARDNEGNQALHYAVRQQKTAMISVLLQAGADVQSANYARQTPMVMALKQGDEAVLVLLKENVSK